MDHKGKIGWLARIFGPHTSAPTYVAGLVALICVVALVLSPIFDGGDAYSDTLKILILTCLAYLFGTQSRKSKSTKK